LGPVHHRKPKLGCRNFTAIAENFNSTWINLYSVFIRMYGSADSQTNGMLTPEEAAAIPGTHRYLVGMYYVLVTVGTVGYTPPQPPSGPFLIL